MRKGGMRTGEEGEDWEAQGIRWTEAGSELVQDVGELDWGAKPG